MTREEAQTIIEALTYSRYAPSPEAEERHLRALRAAVAEFNRLNANEGTPMTREQLVATLAAHKEWFADPTKGTRADLRGADLSGADLRGAELRGANLRGANLRGADLSEADGYLDLGYDPRGYHFRANLHDNGWIITAGCRCFAYEDALAHWRNNPDALARMGIVAANLPKNERT